MVWQGEKEAWDILSALDSKDVETRAGASFNADDATYKLTCLGQEILVSLPDRDIAGSSVLGTFFVKELGEYSRLSILRYLIHSKNLPLSGKLIKPADLPGGDFFARGTHVLPMDRITDRFETDLYGLFRTGGTLGGTQAGYGDASVTLFPFKRIPVTIILWSGDDEFPSKSSLLFDSSCASHMSIDILWSTAMMTIEMMLA